MEGTTLSLCLFQMLEELERFLMCGSRDPKWANGKWCQGTGELIGRVWLISMLRACPLESKLAMEGPAQPITLHLPTGDLANLSKAMFNSKIKHVKILSMSPFKDLWTSVIPVFSFASSFSTPLYLKMRELLRLWLSVLQWSPPRSVMVLMNM